MGHQVTRIALSFTLSVALLGCNANKFNPYVLSAVPTNFVYTGNVGQVFSTTQYGSQAQGSLSGFSADPSTGVLTPLSGFPLIIGSGPSAPLVLTHDPQNRFLIAADKVMSAVHILAINIATGTLTEVPTSPDVLDLPPVGVVTNSNGSFLYVANKGNEILTFSLSSSGTLAQVGASVGLGVQRPQLYYSGQGGSPLQMSADGRFLYFNAGAIIAVYTVDPTNGSVTQVQRVTSTNNGRGGFVFDPAGKYLYDMGDSTNSLSTYAIDAGSGLLTLTNQNTLLVETLGDASVAISPSGKFAYTIENGNSLVTYAVTNGVFTPIGTPLTGYNAVQLLIDPTGTFLYVPQTASSGIDEFSIASNGFLTPLSPTSVSSGAYPNGIAVVIQ